MVGWHLTLFSASSVPKAWEERSAKRRGGEGARQPLGELTRTPCCPHLGRSQVPPGLCVRCLWSVPVLLPACPPACPGLAWIACVCLLVCLESLPSVCLADRLPPRRHARCCRGSAPSFSTWSSEEESWQVNVGVTGERCCPLRREGRHGIEDGAAISIGVAAGCIAHPLATHSRGGAGAVHISPAPRASARRGWPPAAPRAYGCRVARARRRPSGRGEAVTYKRMCWRRASGGFTVALCRRSASCRRRRRGGPPHCPAAARLGPSWRWSPPRCLAFTRRPATAQAAFTTTHSTINVYTAVGQ